MVRKQIICGIFCSHLLFGMVLKPFWDKQIWKYGNNYGETIHWNTFFCFCVNNVWLFDIDKHFNINKHGSLAWCLIYQNVQHSVWLPGWIFILCTSHMFENFPEIIHESRKWMSSEHIKTANVRLIQGSLNYGRGYTKGANISIFQEWLIARTNAKLTESELNSKCMEYDMNSYEPKFWSWTYLDQTSLFKGFSCCSPHEFTGFNTPNFFGRLESICPRRSLFDMSYLPFAFSALKKPVGVFEKWHCFEA